jgi:hypothetical protein
MGTLQRQNTLFISEDWIRIYEAIQNVDFRAYDFQNLVSAILDHLRETFPEEFNDWIASSEFIMKVEVLAWLSQNISFRIDLNTRENFLATAERRDSLIRLAQNVAYRINRVRGARGQLRLERVRTNQSIFDSNNIDLQDRDIIWNDPRNEDWFEQFIIVMNAAFVTRTKFGRPLVRVQDGNTRIDQYILNSNAPTGGVFPFSVNVNGVGLPFEIINSRVDKDTGQFIEFPPNPQNAVNVFYRQDGRGLSSNGTGFFMQVRQGTLNFQDEEFTNPEIIRTVDIDTTNINNDDFFVQQLDEQSNVIATWERVDTVFGESVSFNVQSEERRRVYEIDTLDNDSVRIRFGDGKFGAIPQGKFRFWFRTSNPQPQIVNPTDIRNQTITIPYAVGGQIFFLTMTFSLKNPIVNAAATESNFNIRTRANQVFYTQNRMITGRDYNNFFLRDNAISKVKTVNRTFAGHSRFTKLHDPTGLYQNLKIVAEDGRLYSDRTIGVQFASADEDILSIDELVDDFIKPLVRKADKSLLYFNDYPEKFFGPNVKWSETAVIGGQSRGNVTDNNVIVPVGTTASGNFRFIQTDSVIRIMNPRGDTILVSRVVDDGTAPDGVILEIKIPDDVRIVSVFPPFRSILTNAEQSTIKAQLDLKLDFGITWNQDTQTWNIITNDNINKTGEFSLVNQGDTSSSNLDSSWMIMLEFIPGGTEDDQWRITDRGFGVFFESAREHDFFFASDQPAVDPETGSVVNDTVILLDCNESKNSLRRRGLAAPEELNCPLFVVEFQGDGTTTCFKTQENPLDPNTPVTVNGLLQVINLAYTIVTSISGDEICFFAPPPNGSQILITISAALISTTPKVFQFTGDGSTEEFDLDDPVVVPNNTIAFIEGVMQTSSLDYGIGIIGNNASFQLSTILGAGLSSVIYTLPGIDSNVWSKFVFVGNGTRTDFQINLTGQSVDTILIHKDGVIQDPSNYTIVSTPANTVVTFNTPPGVGARVRIIAATNASLVKSKMFSFDTDGTTNTFTLTGLNNAFANNLVVALDGIMQEGSWSPNSTWSMTGPISLTFIVNPPPGLKLTVFFIGGAVGTLSTQQLADEFVDGFATNNLGNPAVSSCAIQYLGEPVPLFVEDVLRHDDGYVNVNGIQVKPADKDQSGFFDNPFLFKDLVIQDGVTDLVLWRRIEEFGFTINDPINRLTSPKGTYGRSSLGAPQNGSTIDSDVADGDIHYDITTNNWLIANSIIGTWESAPDQSLFRYKIGRDHLKFIWKHFAPDAFRIDPSVSNVMDAFILTSTFDDAFRVALFNNVDSQNLPVPPTPESLRIQFADFNQFKAMSDSIIFYSARYKPLFGRQAIEQLQATFKLVQTIGSRLSENDLKLRVLTAIEDFFELDNFDFGETFYMTELLAFIHQELAPEIQSVVAVPKKTDQTFGRLFQVRSESDELFISAASPEDIEVVTSLTDEELRIGTFVV